MKSTNNVVKLRIQYPIDEIMFVLVAQNTDFEYKKMYFWVEKLGMLQLEGVLYLVGIRYTIQSYAHCRIQNITSLRFSVSINDHI